MSNTNLGPSVTSNSVPQPIIQSGGLAAFPNIDIGPVAYGSLGTNSTDVAGQFWITDIWVPASKRITKIGFLQGGTATTDNFLVALYDSAGNLLGNSTTTGVVLSGANTFQEQTLVAPVQVYGPQQYYVAIQGSGTTAGSLRTIATSTWINRLCGVVAGTFGTVPSVLAVPATFTADKGPIVYLK